MLRIASPIICAFVFVLLFINGTAVEPRAGAQPPMPAGLKEEIGRVNAEIDKIFADTLGQLPSIPVNTAHRMKRVQTLGKLLLFDKELSVNRNEACSFCHMP